VESISSTTYITGVVIFFAFNAEVSSVSFHPSIYWNSRKGWKGDGVL
jgi:hypothetical protein